MDGHDGLMLPPQSIESEQAVLGGLLLRNDALDLVADTLTETDFYRADHRLIFRAISRLVNAAKPADALTVAEFLSNAGKLEDVGGQAYLGSLAVNTPSTANIRRYAEIVRDKAILRSLMGRAQEMLDACMSPNGSTPAEIAEKAEQAISALMHREHGAAAMLGDALTRAIEHVDAMFKKGGGLAGLSTGFVDLDNLTGGLADGDLIILAGRTSMGKTALAMNITEHVAVNHGPVAFFSLEMSERQLALRVLSGRARVPMYQLRSGRLGDDEWPRIADACGKLLDLPIHLDDRSAATCAHIRARCRQIKRQGGLALVVIDYLQLMRGDGDNRTQEVGSISRGLKGLAKDLDVPVIALSQLSRRVEDRPDKRPNMSDLRDSGEIEQDADLIAFVYRDEVYDKNSPAKGTAELLVKKQRNGPLGDVRLWFRESLMKFESYTGPEIRDEPRPRQRATSGFDYKTAKAGGE